MRYELKRIAIWPFIKVSFFVNLLIGFVFGLFYSPIVSVILMVLTATPYLGSPDIETAPSWGTLLFIIPFISAFLAGCINTLIGLFLVLAYNMFAILVGGLEVELDPVKKDAPPPLPAARPIEPPPDSRTIYASSEGVIPPPPPPPPVRTDAGEYQRTLVPATPEDNRPETPTTSFASQPPDETLREPGEPTEPFADESSVDRPDDLDADGSRNA